MYTYTHTNTHETEIIRRHGVAMKINHSKDLEDIFFSRKTVTRIVLFDLCNAAAVFVFRAGKRHLTTCTAFGGLLRPGKC